jgi:hypothetical protein
MYIFDLSDIIIIDPSIYPSNQKGKNMLSADYSFDIKDKNDDAWIIFTYGPTPNSTGDAKIKMKIFGSSIFDYKPNDWRELAKEDSNKKMKFVEDDGTAAVAVGCIHIYSRGNELGFITLDGLLQITIIKTDQVIELLNQIADELEKYPNPFKNITPSENHEFMPYE